MCVLSPHTALPTRPIGSRPGGTAAAAAALTTTTTPTPMGHTMRPRRLPWTLGGRRTPARYRCTHTLMSGLMGRTFSVSFLSSVRTKSAAQNASSAS